MPRGIDFSKSEASEFRLYFTLDFPVFPHILFYISVFACFRLKNDRGHVLEDGRLFEIIRYY